MENKNTSFIFDGSKAEISQDLLPTYNFLKEIENEIETFLKFGKEAEKLKINHPIRSEMIVLFANLETLIRLNFAYDHKINDDDQIRGLVLNQKVWENFYNDFCLNVDNEWVRNNQERAKHITAQELRYLRNSLTHFFSLDKGLQIAFAVFNEKSRKIEQSTNFKVKFISTEDLHEIIKGAFILMIQKWSNDCQECLKINSNEFKERILSVNALIKKSGPVIIKNEQIKV